MLEAADDFVAAYTTAREATDEARRTMHALPSSARWPTIPCGRNGKRSCKRRSARPGRHHKRWNGDCRALRFYSKPLIDISKRAPHWGDIRPVLRRRREVHRRARCERAREAERRGRQVDRVQPSGSGGAARVAVECPPGSDQPAEASATDAPVPTVVA